MRTIQRIILAGAVLGGAACHGDGGTGPSPASLTATWQATKAEFVNIANSSNKVDLVATGGSVVLVLTEGKTWTMTIRAPGDPDDVRNGTWSSSTDVLTLAFSGSFSGEMQFDMSLSGNTLTLSGGHTPFDVNGDGSDEETTLTLVLARQ
jgi:hypothetical protein